VTHLTVTEAMLDSECAQIYGSEHSGDVTDTEATEMVTRAHALAGRPLYVDLKLPAGPAAEIRAVLLADLRWHWGEAYEITWRDPAAFRAVRRDTGAAVETPIAGVLFAEIAADYRQCPVLPRGGGFLP
jgi:hypothetical protein